MNFNDSIFWIVLVVCYATFRLISKVVWQDADAGEARRRFDVWALLATSLTLFYFASPVSLAIFLFEMVVSYAGLRLALRQRGPRRALTVAVIIAVDLSFLVYFKYAGFVLHDVLGLSVRLPEASIPPGISFFTFQIVAFVIDSLQQPAAVPTFLGATNFISFFPQVVAGPIERRADLLPQVETFRFRINSAEIVPGVQLIVLGLFYKMVLGDNLGTLTQAYRSYTDNPYLVWWMSLLFGLRIYFDFAGYSLIAVGLGQLFGVRLTYNFRAPYTAQNIREFWQRWHVTLSTWFKDYLYIPLGGSRVRWWTVNIMLTFVVSGLWHGAGVNFLIWGAVHGLLLIGYNLCQRSRWASLPVAASTALTFGCVTFSWLFFYETNSVWLRQKLVTSLTPQLYGPTQLLAAAHAVLARERILMPTIVVLLIALACLACEFFGKRGAHPYEPFLRTVVTCVLIAMIVLLGKVGTNAFVYFAF